MQQLTKALKALGVKGIVTAEAISKDRVAVYVNGKRFGIWDVRRETFVD